MFSLTTLLLPLGLMGGVGQSGEVIPDHVITRANAFVESRVGREFFASQYTYYHAAMNGQGNWAVSYTLRVPGSDYRTSAEVWVSPDPGVTKTLSYRGVPDCVHRPADCDFRITAEEAARIAEKAGLKPSLEPVQVWMEWNGDREIFTWAVTSVIELREDGKTSECYQVNASTGEVVNKIEYEVVWCGLRNLAADAEE